MSFQRLSEGVEGKSLSYMLSSCVSVTCRYCIEMTGRIELVFGMEAHSTHPTLCYKEIWISPKIRVLPSVTLSKLRIRKVRHGNTIALSTILVVVVVDGRRHVHDNRRVVAVYYKSVNCNPLTHLTRFVLHLVYDLLYSWQDYDWHIASRGPSAVAELLVF